MASTNRANPAVWLVLILGGGILLGIHGLAPGMSASPTAAPARLATATAARAQAVAPGPPGERVAGACAGKAGVVNGTGWAWCARPSLAGPGDARAFLLDTSAQQRLPILPRVNRAELTR